MGIKKCLKINLLVGLILSLFSKISLLTVVNGEVNFFIFSKVVLHFILIVSVSRESLWITVIAFVLDLILYAIFVVFELIFTIAMLIAIMMAEGHTRIAFIGITVCLIVAVSDLCILIMIGIAIEQMKYRQQLLEFEQTLISNL